MNMTRDAGKWNKLTQFKWDENNKNKFPNGFTLMQKEICEISQRTEAGLIESTGQIIKKLYFQVAKMT